MAPDLELTDKERKEMDEDAADFLAREGLKAGIVEEWEDGYRTASQPDAFEWWYFDAQLDGGWTVVIVYSTKPMTKPRGPLKPTVQIILHDPEGKRRRLSQTFMPRGEEIVTGDGLPLSLVTGEYVSGPGGRSYPKRLDIHWHSEDGDIMLAIRDPKLIETIDVIEDLPRWQQGLIHLVANPLYYDFDADVTLDVEYGNIKTTEKGMALFEIMMLRQEGGPMSCYFRHMADIFEEAGVEVTPRNRKDVDRKIHEIVGVTYKDCPATWRKVKEMKAEAAGRDELISRLKT